MAINPKKHEMPTQEPAVRAHNFDEVALGYNEEIAIAEAQRCLNCKNAPCVNGCPVNIDIPNFISHIKDGNFEGAYNVISLSSSLPAVCGRVCPQETQCESKCTLGLKFEPVGIGRLERFGGDTEEFDADVLLVYGADVEVKEVIGAVKALKDEGKSVRVASDKQNAGRYRQVIVLGKED